MHGNMNVKFMQMKMSMEDWCNDNDWRKPKYTKETLSKCHPVHHKCHKYWPGIETGLLLLVCKYVHIYIYIYIYIYVPLYLTDSISIIGTEWLKLFKEIMGVLWSET